MILAAEYEFCYAVYVFDYIDVVFLVRGRGYLLLACAHSELYSQRGDFARQLRSRLFVFERYFAEAYAEVYPEPVQHFVRVYRYRKLFVVRFE